MERTVDLEGDGRVSLVVEHAVDDGGGKDDASRAFETEGGSLGDLDTVRDNHGRVVELHTSVVADGEGVHKQVIDFRANRLGKRQGSVDTVEIIRAGDVGAGQDGGNQCEEADKKESLMHVRLRVK